MRRGRRAVVALPPLLVVAAALAGPASSCGGGCEAVVGPEGEIARVLESQRAGAVVAVPAGGTLTLTSFKFDRLLVKPEGEGFTAVATVDVEGRYEPAAGGRQSAAPSSSARATKVSYLGLERAPFVRRDGRWAPRSSVVPALEEILGVMVARRAAIQKRDAGSIEALVARDFEDPRLSREAALAQAPERMAELAGSRALAWFVRVDRERSQVLEEYETAEGRKGQTRFELKREDGRLRIVSGLF